MCIYFVLYEQRTRLMCLLSDRDDDDDDVDMLVERIKHSKTLYSFVHNSVTVANNFFCYFCGCCQCFDSVPSQTLFPFYCCRTKAMANGPTNQMWEHEKLFEFAGVSFCFRHLPLPRLNLHNGFRCKFNQAVDRLFLSSETRWNHSTHSEPINNRRGLESDVVQPGHEQMNR